MVSLPREVPGAACQVVFCNHADHLVSQVPGLPRQHLRIEVHYSSASYIVTRHRLLPRMLVESQDGGEPPLSVLEREGKRGSYLPLPR